MNTYPRGELPLIRQRTLDLVKLPLLDSPSAVLYREAWVNSLRRMFPKLSETQARNHILRAVAVKRGLTKRNS